MIGYILTESEKDQIQGIFFTHYTFFNCLENIDNVWFLILSEQDILEIQASPYAWLLDCPQGEYIPKPTPFPDEIN